MSRYDDPEGMGGDPVSGKRQGPPGLGLPSEDTEAWTSYGQIRRDRSFGPGGPGAPGEPGDSGPRRRRRSFLGPHPILAAAAIISTVLVVGVSLVAYAAVRNVYDGINHEAITAQMLGNRPPKLNGSTNILLIGSDSRASTGGKFGKDVLGARSDTTMVLHITPDHTRAYVLSFPRDSMVPVYDCLPDQEGHPGQTAAPGELEPLNATFSAGGAPVPVEDPGTDHPHPHRSLRRGRFRQLQGHRQRRRRDQRLPAVRHQQLPGPPLHLRPGGTTSTARRHSPSSGCGRTSATAPTCSGYSASRSSWPRPCRRSSRPTCSATTR